MKKLLMFLLLACIIALPAFAGKRVGISPSVIVSPLAAADAPIACVDGFRSGNHVVVVMPWIGDPSLFAAFSYNLTLGSSGSACLEPPDNYVPMDLAPGEYLVQTIWYKRLNDDGSPYGPAHSGPDATLSVVAQ